MAQSSKDTIYIDVDDEITSIVEKVLGSEHKILALVLPKRATVLQSIVNMKLLKRTADEEHKKLVLITSENNILPLAGAVGLHVAKTLQSKPAVPPPPELPKDKESVVEAGDSEEEPVDSSKSVGELAGLSDEPAAKIQPPEETIDIDDAPDESDGAEQSTKNKAKKVRVPNFEKFRLKLILGGLAFVLLIVFWVFATKVWPKATITINTNTNSVDTNFNFNADANAQSLDAKSGTVPAVQKDSQQTNSQKVAATGQKNVGDPSTGTVSLQNCSASVNTVTIPSGTNMSSNGQTYSSQSTVTLPATIKNGLNQCVTPTKDVSVKSTTPGTAGNLSAGSSFNVSGYSSVSGSNANDFSGGTDKTITVVSQKDIDDAKQKITAITDAAKSDLIKQFQSDNLFALPATLLAGKQTVSSSSNVGDQATEVTVTVETDYTMLGVKRDDLKKLVEQSVKDNIDTSKQALSSDGLDKASFTVTSKKSPGNQTLSVQTTASTGAVIDADSLKKQLIGKKSGDVQQTIQALPGVQSVDVKFSPFWVNKVPSKLNKITITINKSQS